MYSVEVAPLAKIRSGDVSGSRSFVYDLLCAGELTAHHRSGLPGTKGIRIVTRSVVTYLENGVIDLDIYKE